jgi:hypothetical protein
MNKADQLDAYSRVLEHVVSARQILEDEDTEHDEITGVNLYARLDDVIGDIEDVISEVEDMDDVVEIVSDQIIDLLKPLNCDQRTEVREKVENNF